MVIDVNVIPGFWTIAGVIISLVVAFAALFLGWYSNRALYKTRRLDKKEAVIKEIIEWNSALAAFSTTPQALGVGIATNRLRELNALLARGSYAQYLAHNVFFGNGALITAINIVRGRCVKHAILLGLIVDGKVRKNTKKALLNHIPHIQSDNLRLYNVAVQIYTEIK